MESPGIPGRFIARFELLQSGHVENVRIQKSSGDTLMDQEVVRALEALRNRGKMVVWPSTVPKDKSRITAEVEVAFWLQ